MYNFCIFKYVVIPPSFLILFILLKFHHTSHHIIIYLFMFSYFVCYIYIKIIRFLIFINNISLHPYSRTVKICAFSLFNSILFFHLLRWQNKTKTFELGSRVLFSSQTEDMILNDFIFIFVKVSLSIHKILKMKKLFFRCVIQLGKQHDQKQHKKKSNL